jgi:CheY-like chemotaxis protein
VVEDDPILMMFLVEFVEQAECEAVEATSVAEAIQILETRTDICTVFTDLDMRGSTAGMQLALERFRFGLNRLAGVHRGT